MTLDSGLSQAGMTSLNIMSVFCETHTWLAFIGD